MVAAKFATFCILIAFFNCLFHTGLANRVTKVEVMTANCEDCGMSILGQLSVKLCGNGPGQCCVAENLDNLFSNDFNEGELSAFDGSTLGECNGFDLGEKSDWSQFMTIYHSGPDGGKFDYVIASTDVGNRIKCLFSKFLDDGDYEVGIDCQPTI